MKVKLKLKLPKKFKEKWLASLRSGEYKQQREGDLANSLGYCCLGVAGKVCGVKFDDMKCNSFLDTHIPGVSKKIPKTALKALDQDCDQDVHPGTVQGYLAEMNDDKKSFKQIANWIEKHL